ncbi:MAG: hypothetical protein U1A28_00905 [Patescibacteria group bacterium]|nr:hypothetical protein [Patescibacteria group bacterium]
MNHGPIIPEEPQDIDSWDAAAESAELAAELEAQAEDEKREEEEMYKELLEVERLSRLADEMEREEQFRQQRRIIAELKDQKEEDGGEYRCL